MGRKFLTALLAIAGLFLFHFGMMPPKLKPVPAGSLDVVLAMDTSCSMMIPGTPRTTRPLNGSGFEFDAVVNGEKKHFMVEDVVITFPATEPVRIDVPRPMFKVNP